MRGAITDLEGFSSLDIKAGDQDFKVTYNADVLSTDQLQAALDGSGEPFKLVE